MAVTGTQLRAFVRTDPARCAWQLRCPQDPASSPEGLSVQAPHWGGRTVPYCKPGWAAALGLRDLRGSAGHLGDRQVVVAVIYIGEGSGRASV